MYLSSDLHFVKAYHVERAGKMLEADHSRWLRDAHISSLKVLLSQINLGLLSIWKRGKGSLRTFVQQLSFSEKPPTPCLDCPPADA